MGEAAICHTLNPRLFTEQLVRLGLRSFSAAAAAAGQRRLCWPPSPLAARPAAEVASLAVRLSMHLATCDRTILRTHFAPAQHA